MSVTPIPGGVLVLNDHAIRKAFRDAFADLQVILARRFAEEISAPKWYWPRPPSPRDIVDDGELRSSYRLTQESRVEFLHAWIAGHALANHEGVRTRTGSRPAREWTKDPLEDAQREFSALARDNLRRLRGLP